MKKAIKIIFAFSVIISQFLIGCSGNDNQNSESESAENKISYAELFAAEEQVLTSFKMLDETKGVYQIPVERALMLIAAEAVK